jgi:Protein of unknown function (DUF2505)
VKLRTEDQYAAAPADVYAAFTDEAFVRARYDAIGLPEYDVLELAAGVDGARIKTRRLAPANVPGFAKKLFGETTEMVQTDVWGRERDGVREGTWTIDVPGKPVKAGGTLRMEPSGGGTVVTIDGDLKVSVPIIGGKLESWAGSEALTALEKEHAFGVSWFAAR